MKNHHAAEFDSSRSIPLQPCLPEKAPARNSSGKWAGLICLLSLLVVISQAPASIRTWDGDGAATSSLWSNAVNWDGDLTVPVSGDDLVFSGAQGFLNTNDIAGLNLNSITYNTFSGYSLFGNAVIITNGITDSTGSNTNGLPLTLGAPQTVTSSLGLLQLNGNVTNLNYNLTFQADALITVAGVIGNGTGSVIKNGLGLLTLTAANTFSGGVVINDGTLALENANAIPNGAGVGDVSIASTAILDVNGGNRTINGLNGSGTVQNGSATAGVLTVGANATNSAGTFSGTLQDVGGVLGLTKINTNTLTLNGGNAFTGPTLVSAGTLKLGASGTLQSSTSVTISPGALLDASSVVGGFFATSVMTAGRSTNGPTDILGDLSVQNGATLNIFNSGAAGTLNVNGGLTFGGGTFKYDFHSVNTVGSGVNDLITINGILNLNAGTIKPAFLDGTVSASPYTLVNGVTSVAGSTANLQIPLPRGVTPTFATPAGSLTLTLSGTPTPATLAWSGPAGASWDVKVSSSWINQGTSLPDVFWDLDNVVFNDSGDGNVNVAELVSPTSTTFNNTLTNYVLSGAGAIGAGGVTLNGGGTVTFNLGNKYGGDTIVNNSSALILGVLSAPPHIAVYNGVTPGNLVLGGGGVFLSDNANDTYRADFNNLIVNPGAGSVAMKDRASSSSYIYQFANVTRAAAGGTLDFNHIQSKAASPQVGLLITNTTTVNGILGGWATIFQTDWVVPVATGAGSVAYAAYQTTTTATSWGSVSNISLTANPAAALNNTTINSLRLPGPSTIAINAGQTLTLTSGGLLVPATASGSSAINGGTLKGGASADLIVHQHSLGQTLTIGSVIADNGGATALTKSGRGTLILTGANTYSGVTFINGPVLDGGAPATPLVIPAGKLQVGNGGSSGDLGNSTIVTNRGTLAFNRSGTVTYGGTIYGNGTVQNIGSGTLILTGNNAYTGPTTINAGTLQLGNGGSTGTIQNSPTIANSSVLVFNLTGSSTYPGIISGIGTLIKQGAGSVTLGGANTYVGATTVSQGTLALGAAGSIANSVTIAVNTGATLDVTAPGGLTLNGAVGQTLTGSGSVLGTVTAPGGSTISPGASIGTLTFGGLALSGATVQMEVSTISSDAIAVTGNLNMSGGVILVTVVGTPLPNGVYPLISYGTKSGSVANLILAGFVQPGQVATLNDTGSQITMVVSTGTTTSLTWRGDGLNNIWDVNGANNWQSNGIASVFKNTDDTLFDDTGSNTPPINISGSVFPSSMTVNSTVPYTFTGGNIGGAGPWIKNGSGTLTVLNTNTTIGQVQINTGTVQVGDGTTGGALGSGDIADNGALMFNEPNDHMLVNNLTGSGSLTKQDTNVLILTGNSTGFSGPTTVNGTLQVGAGGLVGSLGSGSVSLVAAIDPINLITNGGLLVVDRQGTVTESGSISGDGSLVKNGSGNLIVSGNNTYTSNTIINAGSLTLGSSTAIPTGPAAGNVVMSGSSVLELNDLTAVINGLVAGGAGPIVRNGSGTATATLRIGNNDTSSTFFGNINNNSGGSGQLALTKIGAGRLILRPPSANLYGGGTVISNGAVELDTTSSGSSLGFPQINDTGLGTGPVTFYGGLLQLDGWAGSTSPTYGSTPNPIIVPTNQSGTILIPCRVNQGLNGPVTGGGTLYIGAQYVRCYMYANFSAFTGWVVITNSGTDGDVCGIGNAAGMPNARLFIGTMGAGGNLFLFNRVGSNPIIPIGELSGDSGAVIQLNSGGAGGQVCRWLVGGLNTSSIYSGAWQNTPGLIKQGTGKFVLDGDTSIWTGTVVVSNGVLALSNSATIGSVSSITLAAPGQLDVSGLGGVFSLGSGPVQTLQGNGLLLGDLTVGAAGRVAPGFSIGTLQVLNNINLGGSNIMEINATNFPNADQLVAQNGTLTYGGSLVVSDLASSGVTNGTYVFQLFNAPTITGSFTETNLPPVPVTKTWDTSQLAQGRLRLTVNINTTPTTINANVSGNTLQLSWPADHSGWRLQVQTNSVNVGLANNWVTVPGSDLTNVMTFPISQNNGAVFYRMVYP